MSMWRVASSYAPTPRSGRRKGFWRTCNGRAVVVRDRQQAEVRELAVDKLLGDQIVLAVDRDLDVVAHSDPCPGVRLARAYPSYSMLSGDG